MEAIEASLIIFSCNHAFRGIKRLDAYFYIDQNCKMRFSITFQAREKLRYLPI